MIRSFGYNEFLFLLSAVQWTLALSALAFLGGATVGLFVALARTSTVKPVRLVATGYIQVFQGTPLLMQLFLVFSIVAALYFVLCWPLSLLAARLEARYAAPGR